MWKVGELIDEFCDLIGFCQPDFDTCITGNEIDDVEEIAFDKRMLGYRITHGLTYLAYFWRSRSFTLDAISLPSQGSH